MKRLAAMLIVIVILSAFIPLSFAEAPDAASDISAHVHVSGQGVDNIYSLPGSSHTVSRAINKGAVINIDSQEEIGYLYVKYLVLTGSYRLTDNTTGEQYECGRSGFLHELIDLSKIFGHTSTSLTLSYTEEGSRICSINVFTPGTLPSCVQDWSVPLEGCADIVLFCTHGDDDQLFFAGIMPYYARERDYAFQVVYWTDHHNQVNYRVHEMLDGLWAVGITAYPVFGPFPDFSDSSVDNAYERLKNYGFERTDIEAFVTEQIRRFKPLVAVGHDLGGEYGHVQHRIYANILAETVKYSSDPSYYPESAARYGTWDVPKTYLHLYPENKIIMNWDIPLDSFGGMTAFEVTRDFGFPCHGSQQQTRYYNWINSASSAAEITDYNPCRYGLYRTLVGYDSFGQDMFEHLMTYETERFNAAFGMETKYRKFSELQERKEAARLVREEEERALKEAEEKRLEEERLMEEERLANEEEIRRILEEERIIQEQKDLEESLKEAEAAAARRKLAARKNKGSIICTVCVCTALIISALVIPFPAKKQKAAHNERA